jgi:hypothetical protein
MNQWRRGSEEGMTEWRESEEGMNQWRRLEEGMIEGMRGLKYVQGMEDS